MKLHARHVAIEIASRENAAFELNWRAKHELTLAEEMEILTGFLHNQMVLMVKAERGYKEKANG